MSKLGSFMTTLHRMQAFQLIILNAVMMELDHSLFPSAKLIADLAAQCFKGSASVLHRLVYLRRQNACAGLKGKFLESLITDLAKLSFSEDPSKVFGGKVKSAMKQVAKHKSSEKTLQKVRVTNRSFRQRRGGGAYYGSLGGSAFGAVGGLGSSSSFRSSGGSRGRSSLSSHSQSNASLRGRGRGSQPAKRARGRARGGSQRF